MAIMACVNLEPGVYFAMNARPQSSARSRIRHTRHFTMGVLRHPRDDHANGEGRGYISHFGHWRAHARCGHGANPVGVCRCRPMAFWYHFAILFGRFSSSPRWTREHAPAFTLQDLLGTSSTIKRTDSLAASLIATAICVAGWGYFLYQGVVDPLGGINTLWPLFGISNQMLAGVALILCTSVLFKMKRDSFAWVTLVPACWVLVCTLTAAWQKIFDPNPRIGFRMPTIYDCNCQRPGAGARQVCRPDAAGYLQRLCECFPRSAVHAGPGQHAGLWDQNRCTCTCLR